MEWKKLRQVIPRARANTRTREDWGRLFTEHVVAPLSQSADDMLFYVREVKPQLDADRDSILDVCRVSSPPSLHLSNEIYNAEETFYLNLLLHNFNYVLICAVCQQKKPGKDLKVYRSFCVPVYGSPNKHTMSGKAKQTTISYPNIYFSVYNFDEIFDGIVLTDNEMVCVELVAIDKAETVQISVFLGSIRYEVLNSTLASRASLTNKIIKQLSRGFIPMESEPQFVTMNGPKSRGRVEMYVSDFKPKVDKNISISYEKRKSLGSEPVQGSSRTPSQEEAEDSDADHHSSRRQTGNISYSNNTTKEKYRSSKNWLFQPNTSTHHYVNAQLTYLTLRWDELLNDLLECKKKPLLYHA